MGAGTGYWAYYLLKNGVNIKAFDISPPGKNNRMNEYHGNLPAHTEVHRGQYDEAFRETHNDKTLFLCYPPPNSKMALDALSNFKGN